MSMIEIRDLSFIYNTLDEELEVLKNINLDIKEGDFVVVLGESGCGKTTFLNILAGHFLPTFGEVKEEGERISKPDYKRSFIFQQPALLPWLTVKENILFGCSLRGEHTNIESRVDKYIEIFGLKNFENSYPSSLSLGMAQRVAFARALVGKPKVLLLDEPFTSLDFINRKQLQGELVRTWHKERFTAVFVTHDIEEAIILGQKIVLLTKRPARISKIFQLDFDYPRDIYSKELLELRREIQRNLENIKNIF